MHDTPQPLVEHLKELRLRLIYCMAVFFAFFGIGYYFAQDIFQFLVQPLVEILSMHHEPRRLIYTSLTEAFTTYLRVAAFAAFFVTFPFMAIQIWRFVVPGLYLRERRLVRMFFVATPLLFFLGAIFAYCVIFPKAYAFFLSFESPGAQGMLPIQLEPKVNEYLNFVMRLTLAFGICFEMPVVLSLLALGGVVNKFMLMKRWRIAVVLIFTLAAFVTPPDIFSMIGLAIPLLVLYALSILMIGCIEKRLCPQKCIDVQDHQEEKAQRSTT